jgi:hypothetical protein
MEQTLVKKSNWLKNILDDVDQRAAGRPDWQRSKYAQAEIARLRASTQTTTETGQWAELPYV